jgi:ribonuclease D
MSEPSPEYRFLDDPRGVEEVLDSLAGEKEIAFDLEADSLHSYREKICLIQISSAGANIVIDPLTCRGSLRGLEALLGDARVRKVVHGGDYDVRLLKKDLGFGVRNLFDTMVAAQFSGRTRFGLAAILEESFSVSMDKKYQRADWSARPLPEELLAYAALDTAWLLPLKQHLEAELSRLGRLSWAEEEFRLLEQIEPQPAKKISALNVKGARRLEPWSRALLQRLLVIRDEAAQRMDRPPFKVISNQVLLSWCQSPPKSKEEVMQTRGASKRILALLAPAVLDALGRPVEPGEGPAPPPSEYDPLTSDQRKLLQSLKQVRTGMEEKLGLPPGLLVNSATLERLCRMETGEALAFIDTGLKDWQREAAGEELRKSLGSGTET